MGETARDRIRSERVSFTNVHGCRLSGLLDLPKDGEAKEFAVFSHCFTCSKRYKVAVYLGRMLASRGIGLLRYDFPGLGDSEGDFSQTTFQGYVSDVRHAAEFLRKEYKAPRVLIGHSFGGGASLAAAGSIESVKLVVTFAATAKPGELRPGFKEAKEEAESTGLGRINTDGTTYELLPEFFEKLEDTDLEPSVRSMKAKLLAVHSADDRIVSFDNADLLMKWAPRGQLLRFEDAGHLFAKEEHVQAVADTIADEILR